MRWLSFLFFILISVLFTQNLACSAQEKALVSLDFTEDAEGKIILLIVTEGTLSCTSFYIGGETPRIIFDFIGSTHSLENVVSLSKKGLVRTARFGLHQNPLKTRMVIDLIPGVKKPRYIKDIQDGLIRIEISPAPQIDITQKNTQKEVKEDVVVVNTSSKINEKPVVIRAEVKSKKVKHIFTTSIAENAVVDVKEAVEPLLPRVEENESVIKEQDMLDVEDIKEVESLGVTAENLVFEDFVPPVVELEEGSLQENTQSESVNERESQKSIDDALYLKDIKHSKNDGKEDVIAFSLTSFNIPLVTAVAGESLIVLCEFTDVLLSEEMIREQVVDGHYVDKIKVSSNSVSKTIRVILELKNTFSYDLEQTYYKNANVFSLTVKGQKK